MSENANGVRFGANFFAFPPSRTGRKVAHLVGNFLPDTKVMSANDASERLKFYTKQQRPKACDFNGTRFDAQVGSLFLCLRLQLCPLTLFA